MTLDTIKVGDIVVLTESCSKFEKGVILTIQHIERIEPTAYPVLLFFQQSRDVRNNVEWLHKDHLNNLRVVVSFLDLQELVKEVLL